MLLGAGAVADVLFLNLRERAAEHATLRATGWDEGALRRLVGYEGLLIGAAGSLRSRCSPPSSVATDEFRPAGQSHPTR